MNIIPLLAILASIASLYLAILAYRMIYPYEDVRRALEIANEYRSLTSYPRSKRAVKRAKSMEPEYRRARGLIFRTMIVKFAFITLAYISVALTLTLIIPAVETPYYIPLITLKLEECPFDGGAGECILMPTLYLHFLSFVYAMLLFRELML